MNRESGFTLIETILYIALFTLIMGAVLLATYSMIESTDKSQYRSLLHNESQFAIRKMNWLLNGATSVTVSGNTLLITNAAISGSPIILQTSNEHLAAQINGNIVDFTSDIGKVDQLSFSVSPGSTPPTEVTMNFHMRNQYYDEAFVTKKVIR